MSTAARCAGEMSLTDCTNAPIEPVAASALTVLIAVPTVEVGEADEGAAELARMLGANGHRAVVASNGGRLELSLAASGTDAQRRCAIVHALARAPAWSALIAARMAGVPFVTTWYNEFREQNIFKGFYNGVMTRGERVIAVSDQIAEAIATRYRGASDRIVVVPSRIDFAVFDPALVTPQRVSAVRSTWDIGADTRAIVVSGAILRRKGHHVAVRAAGRLKEMGLRNFSFVFVGEDPGCSSYAGELWDLVLATQTSDVIRIVGPPDDLPAAHSAATAVVCPAIQLEGSQRRVLEAMAMERVVIASDLAVGPETVLAPPGAAEDRMTGLTFKSGDDRELAAALIRLLSAPESVRAAIGRRGRELAVAQSGGEQSAAQMLALYGELARLRA